MIFSKPLGTTKNLSTPVCHVKRVTLSFAHSHVIFIDKHEKIRGERAYWVTNGNTVPVAGGVEEAFNWTICIVGADRMKAVLCVKCGVMVHINVVQTSL